MKTLLLATRNEGKKMELQEMLNDIGISVINLHDIPPLPEVVEDGKTFKENAEKKAYETAKATGYWCLADDSGLVVDALNGQPGIYSARFAGPEASDENNNHKLLDLMKGIDESKRTARFVCCMALSTPEGETLVVEDYCEGIILRQPVGEQGFGYDPLFMPQGYNQSMAQLSRQEKNLISHRGKALNRMKPIIISKMSE
ncbi:MAG: XTP/dITP diphosphatase [Syntrophomonadaceae bacterium]|nr:XTP/dITP diphosphatase [Syntrophomonadaceae bacterium]